VKRKFGSGTFQVGRSATANKQYFILGRIWTNLNLHYIRKLSCKCKLFWLSASWGEDFWNDPTPFLHFCNYLPFEEDLALNLYNSNSLNPRIICTKFDWNWLAGSGEEDFFSIETHVNMVFLLWPLPTPGDHDLYKLESALYQKAFM
jgi:hypothetical protein